MTRILEPIEFLSAWEKEVPSSYNIYLEIGILHTVLSEVLETSPFEGLTPSAYMLFAKLAELNENLPSCERLRFKHAIDRLIGSGKIPLDHMDLSPGFMKLGDR